MRTDHCPYCSADVALDDDGRCPACGKNALDAAERYVPSQAPDDEQGRVEEQEPAIVADPVDDDVGTVVRPLAAAPGFSFFSAVGWCLVLLVAQAAMGCVLGAVLGPLLKARGSFEEPFAKVPAVVLVVFLVVGDLIMLAMAWNRLKPEATRKLAIRKISMIHVLLLALLVLPLSVLCEAIGNWAGGALDLIFGTADALQAGIATPRCPAGAVAYGNLFEEAFAAIAQQPWPVMFLVGCLLPGICEEMFFRGFLGRGLLARYGALGGVTLTSLLFGLYHIDPVQASYAFVVGIVLHCVYLWTRTFWGPMALHTAFNVVGIGTRKLALEGMLPFDGSGEISISLFAVALVASLALCLLLYQSRIRFETPEDEGASIWSPGYPTAALPPASLGASARRGVPKKLSVAMAAAACLGFALLLGDAVSRWFDPDSAWAQFNQGLLHSAANEYDDAVEAYTKAIEADPGLADANLAEALRGRGEAYRLLGELENALDDCNKSLELDPASPFALADRGETYRLMNRTDEALADCNRAIEIDPQFGWAYTVRGSIHSSTGDSQEAIADYEKAILLDPQHAWSCHLLAWELLYGPDSQTRDVQQAIHYAHRSCELTEWSDPYLLATLAAACAEDGEIDLAIRYQRDALNLAPVEAVAEFKDRLDEYEQWRDAE